MKRILALFLSLLPVVCPGANIRIGSQAEFDSLGERILEHIARGEENINVEIAPGHYFFHERHIMLEQKRNGKVNLSLTGRDVTVSGQGEKGPFSLESAYVSINNKRDAPLFTSLKRAESKAEILDPPTGLCRIKADEKPLKASKANNVYIVITQWYLAKYYRVVKIEDGYIYFMAPGAEDSVSAEKSPNSDFHYGKKLPRYALVNSPSSKELFVKKSGKVKSSAGKDVRRCDASCFLYLRGGEIGTLTISGIHFLGSGASSSFMDIYRTIVRGRITVKDCVFEGIRGVVMRIIGTESVHFLNNVVRNCYSHGIFANPETKGIVVKGNKFFNNGLSMSNYFCVICRGESFVIADNYFEDFVYGAIGVGIWYKTSPPHNCSGVIENNECCQSERFSSMDVPFNLMDSGAIYTWTINKDVTIRNNYVHDISGPEDNRGIFCDDGTINVKVVGNRVERVGNSYCIDLRRVTSVETAAGTQIKKANVGNVVKDNIVDGKIRFQQRED